MLLGRVEFPVVVEGIIILKFPSATGFTFSWFMNFKWSMLIGGHLSQNLTSLS